MGKTLSKQSHRQKSKPKANQRLNTLNENEDYGFVNQNNVGLSYFPMGGVDQHLYINQPPLRRYASTSNISSTQTTSDYGTDKGRDMSPRCFNQNFDTLSSSENTRVKRSSIEADARPHLRRTQSWLKLPDIYEMKDEFYDMGHKRRGDCIIISYMHTGNEVRAGTEQDVDKLNEAFSTLGFDVQVKSDLTTEDLLTEMTLYGRKNHDDDDCFVCVILSHGREGYVHTANGETSLSALLDPIKRCSSLLGKPKLFFIQACRGSRIDYGQLVYDGGSRNDETIKKLSTESDVLIAYATAPDYVSWRDTTKGSIYIEVLCELLKLEGHTTKLMELLQKVNNYTSKYFKDSQYCQVPCYTSTLSKSLVFSTKKKVIMVMYNDGTYSNVQAPDAFSNATYSLA